MVLVTRQGYMLRRETPGSPSVVFLMRVVVDDLCRVLSDVSLGPVVVVVAVEVPVVISVVVVPALVVVVAAVPLVGVVVAIAVIPLIGVVAAIPLVGVVAAVPLVAAAAAIALLLVLAVPLDLMAVFRGMAVVVVEAAERLVLTLS